MLRTYYALNKEEKEFWCSEVRSLRARSGVSRKCGNFGKISGLSGLQHNREKQTSYSFSI
jgi:hypothetical protein